MFFCSFQLKKKKVPHSEILDENCQYCSLNSLISYGIRRIDHLTFMSFDQQNPIPWQRKESSPLLWTKYSVIHRLFPYPLKAVHAYLYILFIYKVTTMQLSSQILWLNLCILEDAIVFINDKWECLPLALQSDDNCFASAPSSPLVGSRYPVTFLQAGLDRRKPPESAHLLHSRPEPQAAFPPTPPPTQTLLSFLFL